MQYIAKLLNRISTTANIYQRTDYSAYHIAQKAVGANRENQQIKSNNSPQRISRAFENLLVYFLFRHASEAMDDQDLAARVAFSVFSLLLICKLYLHHSKNGVFDFDALCEICRLYSSEIEYSEENTSILIDAMLQ